MFRGPREAYFIAGEGLFLFYQYFHVSGWYSTIYSMVGSDDLSSHPVSSTLSGDVCDGKEGRIFSFSSCSFFLALK